MMINKRLINTCQDSKKYILLTVLASITATICNIAIIVIIGNSLNSLYSTLKGGGEGTIAASGLLLIAGLMLVKLLANLLHTDFSHRASAASKVKLRGLIYDKLLRLGLQYNATNSTSSIVQAAIEGVEALEVYFGRYLPQFIYALLAPIILFIVISSISVRAAVVFIVCVPLIPISIIAIMKIAKKVLKGYWSSYTNLGETFLDNLQGLTTLKVFNRDGERHRKMNEEAEGFRRVTMRVLSMQLNSITIMDLIAYGGAALGSLVALLQFREGNIGIGQLTIIILLASEFFIPLRLLGSYFHIAMNGMAACERIFALLDSEEGINDKEANPHEALVASAVEDSTAKEGIIRLDAVSFSYDKQIETIKNISLTIDKGFTAIVGESGSGKSTLASLLTKSLEPQAGELFIDDINLQRLSDEAVYSRILLISTNSYIFNGTIRENLLMGKPDANKAELEAALEAAYLKEFVSSLEDKLETQAGEGGSLLSGGQKQRLALARGILANREIMIFDEATSNIDVESEELIWRTIYQLAKEKKIVVISHRLANVKAAEKIILLHKGELAEEGTHQELMNNRGKYFTMIQQQSSLEGRQAV